MQVQVQRPAQGGGEGLRGGDDSDYESDRSGDRSGKVTSGGAGGGHICRALGSLERQMRQDTFFELDEDLWIVVPRREVCLADQCVYRNVDKTSVRKHYHATCSHTHVEGDKKSMRFHHHQLEKVKKHQRSHQSRAPRDHVSFSPSPFPAPSPATPSRSPLPRSSSERAGEVDNAWSKESTDILRSLVNTFGTTNWGHVARHIPNCSPMQCARKW
ncbi:unnamed protein product, partial [Choristocarpus tenellus]